MSKRVVLVTLSAVAALVAVAQAQSVAYVDQNATLEPHDGSAWCHAYLEVSEAVSVAGPGTLIRVADGTYLPDSSGLEDPRTATFSLANGVTLEGGYAGCGAADPDERDIGLYQTLLSGDLNGDDLPDWGNRADNVYHVITASSVDATAVLDGFTVRGGYANGVSPHDAGAGLRFVNGAGPTLTRCTFASNSAQYAGGVFEGPALNLPPVRNCVFLGNAAQFGGVLNNQGAIWSFVNCLFTGNHAGSYGGAIFHAGPYLALTGCTFAGNWAEAGGGGAVENRNALTITNSIFWGNSAPAGPQIEDLAGAAVTWSCVQGGWPGAGNISSDPVFLDADGPDGVPGTADDNARLAAGSPCIDAGNNAAAAGEPTDLDGCLRFTDDPNTPDTGSGTPPVVDMGAYERSPDCNGNGVPDCEDIAQGTSGDCNMNGIPDECEPGGLADCNTNGVPDLCDIYAGTSIDSDTDGIPDECEPVHNLTQGTLHVTIQEGIDMASAADEIEVGPGTYHERINLLGKAITLRSAEGPDVTIIDGDAAGTVITCTSGEGPDTVIEDFTVTHGYSSLGGGMYNESSSPTLVRCIFSGNSSGELAGGVVNNASSPTLINCTFSGNSGDWGGGMVNANAPCSPTLINCSFSGNSAGYGGGGMFNWGCSPTLTNCTFSGNSASGDGGGMYNDYISSPMLANCTFSGNSASADGGGMANLWGSSPMLANCTFSGNSAAADGGGMANLYDSSPTLANCILWGNTAPVGSQIYDEGAVTTATFSCIEGGWPGTGNLDANPQFVAADTGDLRLRRVSPCIDAGNNVAVPPGITSDLAGNPRFVDAPETPDTGHGIPPIVDIGAYEFQLPRTADLDADGDVDMDDFNLFQQQFTGPHP